MATSGTTPAEEGQEVTVAVVVATHDRAALLRRCLEGLAAQTRLPDEVIVVDDASRQPAAQIATEFADRLPIQILRNDTPRGAGPSRNAGWRRARSSLIAFTDDDCRPASGWVRALVDGAGGNRILVGRVEPDPADGPIRSILDRSMFVDHEDGRFSTCNVLYPRALLERVDGFDPAFRAYGEDTDLGHRALAAGATAGFAPDALVYHAVMKGNVRAAVRERLRFVEVPRLIQRHPQLRNEVFEGKFFRPAHRRFVYAARAVCTRPLTRACRSAVTEWIEDALYRIPLREQQTAIPAKVMALAALDVLEIAVCLRGSLTFRTLVI